MTPNDAPVLTVHGTEDRTVPYDQAIGFDAALRKAGVPSYLVTIKGAGHVDLGTVADGRVKAFFDKYLRGQSVEAPTTTINYTNR